MNSFMLTGRVLGNLESSTTLSGVKIVNFIIEVDRESKGKDGLTTETFKITCFGNVADYALANLKFGSNVGVNGRLSANNMFKDGKTYYTPQAIAQKLTVMSKY